jgi:hypothetical protein
MSLTLLFVMDHLVSLFIAPSDAEIPWTFRAMYGRPWLALALGLASGLLFVGGTRKFWARQSKAAADLYFLTREARTRESRATGIRKELFVWVGCVTVFFVSVALLSGVLRADPRIAMFGAFTTFFVCNVPSLAARHREILRRRQIALAWEGMHPPDNRLTLGQKLNALALVVIALALLGGYGYALYFMKTDPMFDRYRAMAYIEEGFKLSDSDATRLKRKLEANPANHDTRLKLVAYHFDRWLRAKGRSEEEATTDHKAEMSGHVRYFVVHLPGHRFTADAQATIPRQSGDPHFRLIADLWTEQVHRHPTDPAVLWNAAAFFESTDDDIYRSLLQRGRELEPKEPRWSDELNKLKLREAN